MTKNISRNTKSFRFCLPNNGLSNYRMRDTLSTIWTNRFFLTFSVRINTFQGFILNWFYIYKILLFHFNELCVINNHELLFQYNKGSVKKNIPQKQDNEIINKMESNFKRIKNDSCHAASLRKIFGVIIATLWSTKVLYWLSYSLGSQKRDKMNSVIRYRDPLGSTLRILIIVIIIRVHRNRNMYQESSPSGSWPYRGCSPRRDRIYGVSVSKH